MKESIPRIRIPTPEESAAFLDREEPRHRAASGDNGQQPEDKGGEAENFQGTPISGVTGVTVPDAWYDIHRKEYLVQDTRNVWIALLEGSFRRHCKMHGISARTIESVCYSPFDKFVTKLQNERGVDFAGQLAGYSPGIYEENGSRILITKGPNLITPKAGRFKLVQTVLQNVLADDDYDQICFFHAWLAVGMRALYAGRRAPGQALVQVGPANSGKSLLQDIITALLGGREAKPYSFMTGATHFNGHLAGAEHLRISDENPLTDMRSRRNLGAQIKNICVEASQNIEDKHRTAVTLKPFWRLSVSLNDEPENLLVLPPLDEHTLDKLILLKAYKRGMPMPTATNEQREAFWHALTLEFPAYANWLLNTFEIPDALACERFGVTHFHHPQITRELERFEAYMRLLAMVDLEIFSDSQQPWEGSAEELERKLTREGSVCCREARQLLNWNGAAARHLGRLYRAHPERVQRFHHTTRREWKIFPPDAPRDTYDT
jgi:hypothetical protein